MPPDAALEPEDCNCFAMRSAARQVTQFYDQLVAPSGLRTTQFKRLGPLTINGQAKVMVMDRSKLGRNILPLERKKLITITAGTSDRRAKVLELTSTGEKHLQAARSAWSKAQADFEGTFGAQAGSASVRIAARCRGKRMRAVRARMTPRTHNNKPVTCT
jgi:DNA-binding MarR family transcriptional regulator